MNGWQRRQLRRRMIAEGHEHQHQRLDRLLHETECKRAELAKHYQELIELLAAMKEAK